MSPISILKNKNIISNKCDKKLLETFITFLKHCCELSPWFCGFRRKSLCCECCSCVVNFRPPQIASSVINIYYRKKRLHLGVVLLNFETQRWNQNGNIFVSNFQMKPKTIKSTKKKKKVEIKPPCQSIL